ncbi:MAG: hypothetical protein HY673_18420 [Chloroflexi bacterium]|nr:hypothetical protein [Chloroflexota bacterium]
MEQGNELEKIRQALSQGRLTVPDPVTGYHRSIYGRCPGDGNFSSNVSRIERSGQAITRVVFNCTVCGADFDAAPEAMLLR